MTHPLLTRRKVLTAAAFAATAGLFPMQPANATQQVAVLNDSLIFSESLPKFTFSEETNLTIIDSAGHHVQTGTTQSRTFTTVELKDGFYHLNFADVSIPFIVATQAKNLPADPFWGVCTNFTNQATEATHRPEKLIPDLARIGVRSVRETYLWEKVEETALGSYTQLPKYAERNDLLAANGINTFYCASNTHKAFGPWRNLDAASSRDAYARHIVQALTANPQLKSVEIYNEFNNIDFNRGNRSGANYASLLKHVYPIIKSNHPTVEVIAGATAGEAFSFARDFFTAGGGEFMDAWSYHPYSVSGRGIFDAANVYRSYMLEAGTGAKPCHVSELGWSITTQDVTEGNNAKVHSELDQAINLLNAYVGAWSHPEIKSAHWYNALTTSGADWGTGEDINLTEAGFGLFTLPVPAAPNAYLPRLSAYAYYALRVSLANQKAESTFLADEKYKYPVFGAATSSGDFLISTSGWISGAVDETLFDKNVAPSTLIPALADTPCYWKAKNLLGGITYGYGTKIPSTRTPALVTLSEKPFGEGETYPVHGAIGDYYRARGATNFFGNPVSAQEPIAGGWVQRFSKNRFIYWHAETGAREIWTASPIGKRYLADGGPAVYGFPSTSESAVNNFSGAWEQKFKMPGGKEVTLTRTPGATTAYLIDHSTFMGEWWSQNRDFGLPTQDAASYSPGLYQELVSSSGTKNLMCWSPLSGSAVVNLSSGIGQRWTKTGGIKGWGFPKYNEFSAHRTSGSHQSFINANSKYETYAYWTSANGTSIMDGRGPNYRAWVRAGGEVVWGHPIADQVITNDGLIIQEFSRIKATYNPKTKMVNTIRR